MAAASEECRSADRSVGTRLNSLFQLLEKTLSRTAGNKKSDISEELTQIRYVTSKLLTVISSQDKAQKDIILKQSNNIEILVNILQTIYDDNVVISVINIINELLGKAPFGKRASILVNHGVSSVLFNILRQAVSADNTLPEDAQLTIHCILGRIGHKDRKFAVKARLNNVLLLTLNLLKSNTSSFKNMQILLQVFKYYTSNSVNASYVGKHNSISILFKIIALCGKKHTTVLKLALDSLNNLTKSKSNSARTIGMGGVTTLLTLYTEWHQFDTKHKYNNLKKSILHILKNITNLKSGRKALLESDGIRILYETCQDISESREMESLILLASIIMRKCCPRNKLPLENTDSAVTFPLPLSDRHVPDCEVPDSDNGTSNGNESDHSSLDNDDDIDSDDERFRTDHSEDQEDDQTDAIEQPEPRSVEELRSYSKFFPELFEFETRPVSRQSISGVKSDFVTPEADNQSILSVPTCRRVHSFSNISETLPKLYQNSTTSSESDSVLFQFDKLKLKNRHSVPDLQFESKTKVDSATAVNLKTGTSVFTLDVQLPSPIKSNSKSATDAMCITPLVTPRDQLEEFIATSVVEDYEEDVFDWFKDPQLYSQLARETKSVYRFEKVAYPDLNSARGNSNPEKLYNRKFGVQRVKIFEDIDRMIHSDLLIERIVYDLGEVVNDTNYSILNVDHLIFNAQFESANLRRVIQVREFEYDLILNPDINTNHHHQWFYFQVSNMIADVPYRFNIVNCEKINSQFNFGMKPVIYSVGEAMEGRDGWMRTGTDICYYKNHFIRSAITTGGVKGKSYYTTTFTVTFKHDRDICYLAYHYPYTYTTLKCHLYHWESICDASQIFYRHQSLCETLAGNSVPVLTITAQPSPNDNDNAEFKRRPYIFLSSRVHPGESNSSWVMKGSIDYLLSSHPAAQRLRETYIFKIVPMLNPDGVINGNHRSSLVAEDLNRRWSRPCPKLHPTIYHSKGLLHYLNMINRTPMVSCDYHGHSRRKNIFMYGCSPSLSWIPNDTQNPASTGNKHEDNGFKTLPRLLSISSPAFCLQNCSFVVERCKESTARVVIWRQLGVARSYTMESSYCGCDQGKYKDQHLNTNILEEMGHKFCESLMRIVRSNVINDSNSMESKDVLQFLEASAATYR
ncbi:hypothetical protein LOTGIDRAFT_208161 [Lottia gigantea]|uniref:tubulin-glutamate carboxypeptidase n=1 Tax=Lottia gigantea TaxID=225164 RepID=V4B425_LOTGI|nr:hypothetical protein LOTGIDRAFT_208161 [Lottia gigantea]ESP05203.1 hypothetical protein LOTGIDRAFT_208161 [Lottia gigantea]